MAYVYAARGKKRLSLLANRAIAVETCVTLALEGSIEIETARVDITIVATVRFVIPVYGLASRSN
jgi:hypothetical protein